MDKILCLLLLFAILGVSIATLVKKDHCCKKEKFVGDSSSWVSSDNCNTVACLNSFNINSDPFTGNTDLFQKLQGKSCGDIKQYMDSNYPGVLGGNCDGNSGYYVFGCPEGPMTTPRNGAPIVPVCMLPGATCPYNPHKC